MYSTIRAVVRDGKIELIEQVPLPEGASALVTLIPEEDAAFWQQASQESLDRVWDNPEDDVYGQLLKE